MWIMWFCFVFFLPPRVKGNDHIRDLNSLERCLGIHALCPPACHSTSATSESILYIHSFALVSFVRKRDILGPLRLFRHAGNVGAAKGQTDFDPPF